MISVPFVDEVEKFNNIFGKINNFTPTIPVKEDCDFIYNFILEELNEMKEGYEAGNIVEVLDAQLDILYVLMNGVLLFGLKDKITSGYQEVQNSNLSKTCKTLEEAIQTVKQRSLEQEEPCHFEQKEDYYVVYRTRDKKVMKSINYFKPNLKSLFTEEELESVKNNFSILV